LSVFLKTSKLNPIFAELFLVISLNVTRRSRNSTGTGEPLQFLKNIILEGWPDSSKEIHPDVQVYFSFREEFVIQVGVIYKGEQVVVLKTITHSLLQRIHNSHIGIQGCIHRVQDYIFWPNMSKDIESYIGQYASCNTYQDDQQKEPMISHDIPIRPWQTTGCHLFECEGKYYLILADYYLDYFEVEKLHVKTGSSIIRSMKSQFARHGIPDKVISYKGSPFRSREFAEFGRGYEFENVTSSPRYAQSNGKAENAVKITKRLIHTCTMDEKDPFLALLNLRNTPTHLHNKYLVDAPNRYYQLRSIYSNQATLIAQRKKLYARNVRPTTIIQNSEVNNV
jgi:transposase InsO family protein